MITFHVEQTFTDFANELEANMPKVAEVMLQAVQTNFAVGGRPAWLPTRAGNHPLRGSGKLLSSIQASSGPTWSEVGTTGGLPYVNIHQYGGFVPVTEKSKRFFWAMFFETKDPKWMYMALQRVGKQMRVDPRPYMALVREDIEAIKAIVKRSFRFIQ